MATYKAFSAFGIELEYMVVSKDSLDIQPIVDQFFLDFSKSDSNVIKRGPVDWSNELVNHVLELKNPKPTADLKKLAEDFSSEIRFINEQLNARGCQLMPSSMHPWMNPEKETVLWPRENNEIYSTYDRIFSCRTHGFSNLQCMHINMPFSTDEEFVRLHSAIRLVLPLIPALTASSPFKEGQATSAKTQRLLEYLKNQKKVASIIGKAIPESVTSIAEYKSKVLEPMYKDIRQLDDSGTLEGEWLNSRAAIPKFEVGCIEIRIPDISEAPFIDLASAAFIIDVVKDLYDRIQLDSEQLIHFSTDELRALFEQTIQSGEKAKIDNEAFAKIHGASAGASAKEILQGLLGKLTKQQPRFYTETLKKLIELGTLSNRLNQSFEKGQPLKDIYKDLSACLADGRFYGA